MATSRPPSATYGPIILVGFLTFLSCLFALKYLLVLSPVQAAVFVIVTTTVVHFTLDIFINKVHRRESTGLDWAQRDSSFERVQTKVLGFLGSIGIIGAVYWLFPGIAATSMIGTGSYLSTFCQPSAF